MPVVVFRGLLGSQESDSVIGDIEAMWLAGSQSKTFRAFLREDKFEPAILGHTGLDIPLGPLTVAALGWDPPERSTHFAATLLSVTDNLISLAPAPNKEEFAVLSRELPRLNTKSMTVLLGEGFDHAMVWERRVDILTHPPEKAIENGFRQSLPEGDLENDLRRMIDDSVNILSELEFNLRRIDEGIPPLNVLWPWGQGGRRRVENVALRLGYPWRIFSHSLAVRGYARLSGFRPERLPYLDHSTGTGLVSLVQSLKKETHSLAMIDFSDMAGEERAEEKAYKAEVLGRSLVMPLMDWHKETNGPLCFAATTPAGDAVIARVQDKPSGRDAFPFDERSLDERQVGEIALPKLLELASD